MSEVQHYLNEIGRIPLLTPAEEIQLGHEVQAMMRLKDKEQLSPQERRIIKRGEKAKRRMVSANLRLVVSVAKKFVNSATTMTLMDLVQEGTLGLVRAVELFDPERGYKFSTYSYWWIRQGMSRALTNDDRSIRLPSHVVEIRSKFKRWRREFMQAHYREPTFAEAAEALEIKPERLKQALEAPERIHSLDQKAQGGNSDASYLVELIPAEQEDSLVDLETSLHQESLMIALDSLDERERHVLIACYCLNGQDPKTMTAIGAELEISRERVRQLKVVGERKLRVKLHGMLPGKFHSHRTDSSRNWSLTKAA